MQSYYIKPKSFYDSLGDVQPSQPYSYAYGDRPVFEFVFLPNEIAEGDTLVFAVDNDMVFYDNAPENLLHSASCMVVVRHYVTAEEATQGKVQLRIETRTVKFRDVTNGKVRPVEVISGLYRRRGEGDDVSYVLLARGRAFANGIIADYDALPEPITIDEYYTKGDIDGLLGEKANESALVAHTDNSDIHVTLQDKTTWDSKADIGDIGNATVTITQGGETRGSFSVNASENVTIDLTGGAQADWNETDTTSPAYIQHKPSVYTKTETDGMLDAKADKASVYTKGETDGMLEAKADKATTYTKTETDVLLDAKANVATTLSGYGIQDAYTKTETDGLLDAKADKATTLAGYGIADAYTKGEVDAKVTSVYRYKGTVSTYADLPSSGQEVGDVWNIETADSAHGIKAGDNVAWNGTTWDVLAGEIDLTAYPTKSELATVATTGSYNDLTNRPDLTTKLDAPAVAGTVGQVLTKTADGQEWADAPAGGGGEDTTDYLCFTAMYGGITVRLDKNGNPPTISLEYSTDKRNWTEYTWSGNTGATITLAKGGDRVWWRGDNTTLANDYNNFHQFKISGSIEATGNIMSLLDRQLMKTNVQPYCFSSLFHSLSYLNKAPKLPAKTLAKYCYKDMFYGCSSLTKAPELPATRMADYCYYSMFGGCSSLTKAPELPAKTLALNCYNNMFGGCSSLREAPELPATTLADACYYSMFYGCSSLTKAPELPATVLTDSCYLYMFYNCKALKKVKVGFYDWKSGRNATLSWLTSVPSGGVFECPSVLDCSTIDDSHIPSRWSIIRTNAPMSIISPTLLISAETYDVSPSNAEVPVITVSSALMLSASTPVASKQITYSEIVLDVATGATVTAGTNMTFVDAPTAGKRNICVVRWSNGVAKLYVTIVEALPQA